MEDHYLMERPLCLANQTRPMMTGYRDRVQFEVADFLYRQNQMSAGNINFVTGLWAASLAPHNDSLLFKNAKDMYDTIDATPLGNVPWQSFTMNYKGSHVSLFTK